MTQTSTNKVKSVNKKWEYCSYPLCICFCVCCFYSARRNLRVPRLLLLMILCHNFTHHVLDVFVVEVESHLRHKISSKYLQNKTHFEEEIFNHIPAEPPSTDLQGVKE